MFSAIRALNRLRFVTVLTIANERRGRGRYILAGQLEDDLIIPILCDPHSSMIAEGAPITLQARLKGRSDWSGRHWLSEPPHQLVHEGRARRQHRASPG
jgi:hypothetical protein